MRYLLYPLNLFNIINIMKRGRQSAMHAEHLLIDDGRNWKVIEYVCEQLPDPGIAKLTLTFCIETIYLSNLPRLMITPNQANTVRIPQF